MLGCRRRQVSKLNRNDAINSMESKGCLFGGIETQNHLDSWRCFLLGRIFLPMGPWGMR